MAKPCADGPATSLPMLELVSVSYTHLDVYKRQVRIGTRDGDWVEVVEGLEPGQRVVSRGAWLVKLAATGTGEIGHGHAH